MTDSKGQAVAQVELGWEDRGGIDRRQRPTQMMSRYTLLGGRRRLARRDQERPGSYVDVHGNGLFLVVVAIAALNVLDAFFTTLFLTHGGEEINPLVRELVHYGPWPFVIGKSVGIGACVAFLTITKNFRIARIGLAVVLVGYMILLGWHLYLWFHLPE